MKHSRRSRQERREQAEARNEATAKLTPKERLTIIRSRPGNSLRERERIIAQIEKQGEKKPKPKAKGKGRSGKDFHPTGRGH